MFNISFHQHHIFWVGGNLYLYKGKESEQLVWLEPKWPQVCILHTLRKSTCKSQTVTCPSTQSECSLTDDTVRMLHRESTTFHTTKSITVCSGNSQYLCWILKLGNFNRYKMSIRYSTFICETVNARVPEVTSREHHSQFRNICRSAMCRLYANWRPLVYPK